MAHLGHSDEGAVGHKDTDTRVRLEDEGNGLWIAAAAGGQGGGPQALQVVESGQRSAVLASPANDSWFLFAVQGLGENGGEGELAYARLAGKQQGVGNSPAG
jgi:hypothetical protein